MSPCSDFSVFECSKRGLAGLISKAHLCSAQNENPVRDWFCFWSWFLWFQLFKISRGLLQCKWHCSSGRGLLYCGQLPLFLPSGLGSRLNIILLKCIPANCSYCPRKYNKQQHITANLFFQIEYQEGDPKIIYKKKTGAIFYM